MTQLQMWDQTKPWEGGNEAAAPEPLPTEEEIDELAERMKRFLQTQGKSLEKSCGRITPLRYSEDNEGRHVEYMARENHPAVYSVTRRLDGSLMQRHQGREAQHHTMRCTPELVDELHRQLSDELGRKLTGEFSNTELARVWSRVNSRHTVDTAIRHRATQAERRNTGENVYPEDWREEPPRGNTTEATKLRHTVDKMVRGKLTMTKFMQQARKIGHRASGAPSPEHYNCAVLGGPTPKRPDTPEWKNRYDEPLKVRRKSLSRKTLDEAADRAEKTMPQWMPLRFIQEGATSTLEIMGNAANAPEAVLQREADGRITGTEALAQEKTRFNLVNCKFHTRAAEQAAEKLITELLGSTGDPGAFLAALCRNTYGDGRSRAESDSATTMSKVEGAAIRILNNTMATPVMPPKARTKRTTDESLPILVTRLLRTKLADREIMRAADTVFKGRHNRWTTPQYNTLALNSETIAELSRSSKSAIRYYLEHIARKLEHEYVLEGPGEVIDAAKKDLELTPGEWRWFCRMNGGWLGGQQNEKTEIVASCRLLQQANQPKADPARTRAVTALSNATMGFHAGAHADQEWKAWVNTVNRFLKREEAYTSQESRNLTHIADAIRHATAHGLPWGNGTWDELLRRANQRLEGRPAKPINHRWQSSLGQTSVREFTFTPVTSSRELEDWGDQMHNCLANYAVNCVEGRDRIFIAHDADSVLAAAVQLNCAGTRWICVQIEGPGRTAPTEELKRASNTLARRYSEAQTETSTDE